MIIAIVNFSQNEDTVDNKVRMEELLIEAGTTDADLIIFNTPLNKLSNDNIENIKKTKDNEIYIDEIKQYAKEYAIGVYVKYFDYNNNELVFICNHKGNETNVFNGRKLNFTNELENNSICFNDSDINDINVDKSIIINDNMILYFDNGIKEISDKKDEIVYVKF